MPITWTTASERRPGRAASETAIRTARTVLTGIATHDGDEREVYLRAARHGESYLIDWGTDDWSAIEVSATGWRIVARPPVHFWRPAPCVRCRCLSPAGTWASSGAMPTSRSATGRWSWRGCWTPGDLRRLLLCWN